MNPGRGHPSLSIVRQCTLLGLSRSGVYYRGKGTSPEGLSLMGEIDRQYLETPFYESRRMKVWLERQGKQVSRKRVQRLMRVMGLRAIYRLPHTSQPAPGVRGLSLSVGEGRNHQTQPGVGRRHHSSPDPIHLLDNAISRVVSWDSVLKRELSSKLRELSSKLRELSSKLRRCVCETPIQVGKKQLEVNCSSLEMAGSRGPSDSCSARGLRLCGRHRPSG